MSLFIWCTLTSKPLGQLNFGVEINGSLEMIIGYRGRVERAKLDANSYDLARIRDKN